MAFLRGTSWEGWGEIADGAERWETKLDAEDKVAGNVFFFAADYRDAAQLGRSIELVAGHGVESREIAVQKGIKAEVAHVPLSRATTAASAGSNRGLRRLPRVCSPPRPPAR